MYDIEDTTIQGYQLRLLYNKVSRRIKNIEGDTTKDQRAVIEFQEFKEHYMKGESFEKSTSIRQQYLYDELTRLDSFKTSYSKGAKEVFNTNVEIFGEEYKKLNLEEQKSLWNEVRSKIEDEKLAGYESGEVFEQIVEDTFKSGQIAFNQYTDELGRLTTVLVPRANMTPEEINYEIKRKKNERAKKLLSKLQYNDNPFFK